MKERQSKATKYKIKQDKKQKEEKKIMRGIFISEERHKGRGGRIKSQLIPNKIQVRMKRDISYLHQSQVEWVEIDRYSKKQGRMKRKEEKKKQKFKEKQGNSQNNKGQIKKYAQKKQKALQKSENQAENSKQVISKEIKQETSAQIQENLQNRLTGNREQKKDQNKDREQESSENSQSEDELDKKQQKNQQQVGQEKNEEDDIVIIGEIKKQLSNPFWKKPFVGVIKFVDKNKRERKKVYQQKSQISIIMDDFDIDFYPIHTRLPVCYIQKNKNSEKLLEEYVEKNIKINQKLKGGKIRNMILDQLECLYALVSFIQWDKASAYVDLVKIIGKARTIDGQCNCFLYQHELNDFAHTIQQQQQEEEIEINISPIHKQYNQMVFTIDPLTSTDLDDALSVKKISQIQYQIGIHISDVTSYLDKIPREQLLKRTTSVYLPHQVFHMLPHYLVKISSLNPQVKRLAFSVFVRMSEQGEVLSSRLEKNILKSRFKLAYEQAESIIKHQINYQQFNQIHECTKEEFQVLYTKLKIIEKIGLAHRKKRLIMEIFDNDQVKFQLDEDKWPISYQVKSRISSQKIIQEFMIIGNIQTAKKAIQFDPKNSLIIHHPSPSDLGIRQFNDYFEVLDYKFKFQDTISLQKDLLKVSQRQNICEDIKKLCYFKARRVQETASYKRYSQVENIQGSIHFALGLRNYTHFTSPMRRIADIIVHQTLNHIVDGSIPKKQLSNYQIQQANWGRRNTKRLKRDLNQIYFCLMIYKTKKLIETQGIISSFGCKSVSIYIPRFDMNKQIMWKSMKVDKVFKNTQDPKKVDAIIYYDKRDQKKDIIWVVEKFQKIPIKIGCSEQIPLHLTFEFQVKSNKGIQKIKPRLYY